MLYKSLLDQPKLAVCCPFQMLFLGRRWIAQKPGSYGLLRQRTLGAGVLDMHDTADAKLRANVARSVGHVLAMLDFNTAAPSAAQSAPGLAPSAHQDWLPKALQCLQYSMTSSNGKVAWNACYAVGGLLQNPAAVREARGRDLLVPLLQALLTVLREHKNYKASHPFQPSNR